MTTDPMKWLAESRRLDPDLLTAMGVRCVDHPSLGLVVAFAYRRNGEPYAAKFRTVDKRFLSTKGVSRGLYNEDNLRGYPTLPVIITEGEIDALSCVQAGFDRAVSVPDGWKPEGNEREALVAAIKDLVESPFVVVAADNDAAGESLPKTIANLLRGHDVRHAVWPEGCKDPNDVLVKYGEIELAKCINAAKRIDPPGGFVSAFGDMPPLSERRVLRTGMQPFDRVVAFELGAVSVWTGIPGSGKSTFLTWAAEKASVHENIRVGIFAFETHPHTLRDQLSLIRTGSEFRHLDEPNRARLIDNLDRRFRLVHRTWDSEEGHKMGWLEDMIFTLAVRDGCKLIVVDPWNELEHLPSEGETMTAYINWALGHIRKIAEALEIHIAIVAHPKKLSEAYKAPNGYDVADSAAFFNKPSLGVSVHQKEDKDTSERYVELSVWKVRNTRLYGFEKNAVYCNFDASRQSYIKRTKKEADNA